MTWQGLTFASVAIALASMLSSAGCLAAPLSLCKENETAFAVARLLPYEVATQVGAPRPKGGKLLSMCLGRRGESDRLIVRIGMPDDIEVEVEANKTKRFETLQREDHKNFGRQVISLRYSKKLYCIYLPTGQGMGIGLDVFNDEYPWQWMHRLFSGTDRDLEYRVDHEPSVEDRVRALLRPARSTPCM